MSSYFLRALPLVAVLALSQPAARAERVTLPLDGDWQVEESVGAGDMPKTFGHVAPVPGMANTAAPAFPSVDMFDSREVISNRIGKGMLPK